MTGTPANPTPVATAPNAAALVAVRVAVVVIAALLLGACERADAAKPDELVVFAAASLHTVLDGLAPAFEAENGVRLRLAYAGSSDLIAQLDGGAHADILMTADEPTMNRAAAKGLLASNPVTVATNHLTLITPPDNPANITGLNHSLNGKNLIVCAPQVPCGAAAIRLAQLNATELHPVSQEPSVTSVLGKITSGQGDAGLVYSSDALGAGTNVHTIEIPGAQDVLNHYPAAILNTATHDAPTRAWLNLLTSPKGAAAFQQAGFGTP